ncbi:MAG: hypothetical protein NZZ41_00260 [Candidatus Dojkabacteria bacterium]|nr:hypothetical protein [Candidatus Dojkabacteria bacterium]
MKRKFRKKEKNTIIEILNEEEKKNRLKRALNHGIEILEQIDTLKESLKDMLNEESMMLDIRKSELQKLLKAGYNKRKIIDYFENEKNKIDILETVLDILQNREKTTKNAE